MDSSDRVQHEEIGSESRLRARMLRVRMLRARNRELSRQLEDRAKAYELRQALRLARSESQALNNSFIRSLYECLRARSTVYGASEFYAELQGIIEEAKSARAEVTESDTAYLAAEEALDDNQTSLTAKENRLWKIYASERMFETRNQSTALDPNLSPVLEYNYKIGEANLLQKKLKNLEVEHEKLGQIESHFLSQGLQMDPKDLDFLETFESTRGRYTKDLAVVEEELRRFEYQFATITEHTTLRHIFNVVDDGPEQSLTSFAARLWNHPYQREKKLWSSVSGRSWDPTAKTLFEKAGEEFSSPWSGLRPSSRDRNIISKSIPMKLLASLGVFGMLPLIMGHPTDSLSKDSNTALQTAQQLTSQSIDHAKYRIDEWPFIVACVAITFVFLAFGLIAGFPLALGAGLFFSNACWLMAYNNPSTTPVVTASIFGLTLTFACMFAFVEFRKFRHMKLGHGIAVFLTAALFDYVWGGNPFEYLMPCLATSLVCSYWIAPFTKPQVTVREYYAPGVV